MTGLQLGWTGLSLVWIPVLTVVASLAVVGISMRGGADRRTIVDRLLVVWLIAAVVAAALLTLQPGPHAFDGPRPAILNPMSRLDVEDALANTLLYVPVGLFAVFLWRGKPRPVVWATGLGLGLSLTIEMAQWVLPIDRAATTHDVLFNTLGAFLGAVAGFLMVLAARGLGQRPRGAPGER